MKSNRSAQRIFKFPRQQLTLAVVLMMAVAIFFAIFNVVALNHVRANLMDIAGQTHSTEAFSDPLESSFTMLSSVTVLFAIAEILTGFLVAIVMINRIFGPLIPIRFLIERLIEGDYAARGSLRKNDEFQDLMDQLNELGVKLEERHAVKAVSPS